MGIRANGTVERMRRGTGWMVAAVVAVMALGATPVAGATDMEGIQLVQREDLISRDRAADIARSRTGGRVLRVDLRNGDRPWYRVRVLIDGEYVRTVAVDARSGRLRR